MTAPTTGTVSSLEVESSATTMTISHTIAAGDVALQIAIHCFDSGNAGLTVSGVTVNGTGIAAEVQSDINTNINNYCFSWTIYDTNANWPGTGTFDVVITFAGNSGTFTKRASVTSMIDVDTSDPIVSSGVVTGNDTTPSVTGLTSTSNDLMIGNLAFFPSTISSGGTQLYSFAGGGSSVSAYDFFDSGGGTTIDAVITGTSDYILTGLVWRGTSAGLTASGTPTLPALTMAGSATLNMADLTASGSPTLPALTMAGSATLNALTLTASGSLALAPIYTNRNFTDTFGGSGGLSEPSWETFQSDRVDVTQNSGRYRGNLTDNTSNRTLWFNTSQGRGDFQEVTFPFQIDAVNIGIGTQGDSQTAPSSAGDPILFCGINIHVHDLTSLNSSHVVIGHRGSTDLTIEGKNTVSGSSTVTDEGTNSAPTGRMDIRIVGTSSNTVVVSYRAPSSSDAFTLYNGTGALPGTAPTYGDTVKVGIITYAQGTTGIPFVGTCDSFTIQGLTSEADLNPAVLSGSGSLIVPLTTLNGVAVLNKTASGAFSVPVVSVLGSAEGPLEANGAILIPGILMSGTAILNRKASGAISLLAITLSGQTSGILWTDLPIIAATWTDNPDPTTIWTDIL